MPDIWSKFPDFSPEELRDISAVSVQVILGSTDMKPQEANNLSGISSLAAAKELLPYVSEGDLSPNISRLTELLDDEELSPRICLKVLGEIRANQELASKIAAAYETRGKKMAVTETLLLTGALVVLAMKLKEITWGKKGGSVKFDSSGEAVITFIKGLLKL